MTPTSQKLARLSPALIVDAAVNLIATDGFDALSMRKLAQRCGVGAMTLYGYFRTKEELLTAIAEQFLIELRAPDAALSWQDQLKEIFRSTHRVFQRHPALASIAGRQHFNAIAAYRGAELALVTLNRAGLDANDAMSAFTALAAFTAGFSQRQVLMDADATNNARRLNTLRHLPSGEFGHLSKLATNFASSLNNEQFENGLDLFVRGIESKAHATKLSKRSMPQTRSRR